MLAASISFIRFAAFSVVWTIGQWLHLYKPSSPYCIDDCISLIAGSPRVVTDNMQRVPNAAASAVTRTSKFHGGLSYFSGHMPHWLDVKTGSNIELRLQSIDAFTATHQLASWRCVFLSFKALKDSYVTVCTLPAVTSLSFQTGFFFDNIYSMVISCLALVSGYFLVGMYRSGFFASDEPNRISQESRNNSDSMGTDMVGDQCSQP